MDTREERIRQNDDRRSRTEIERAYRRSFRTPKNVGTKTFGGREPGQIFGCKANCLSSCTLRVAWIRPLWEYRKFCSIPRDSNEWNEIYSNRSAVERVFSKLKEHRRLNSHCHRGLAKVRLHCLMSVLSLAITALTEANSNRIERVRACTRRIA